MILVNLVILVILVNLVILAILVNLVHRNSSQVDEVEENKQRERILEHVGKEHLRNLRSIHDQYRLDVQAVQDQHDDQLQAIEENGRLSPTKFDQVQEDIRM